MSQMEPYDYSQMPPDDDDDFEMMQMRGGSSWQPGWRPPSQQRPGCGPPWPPGPGAGGWPFWGYWGFRLRSAWRDVKFLNKLIGDIVNEMIDNGIIAPGPNYVPPSGQTPSPPPGITGVTDGSDAAPGQVGEFLIGTANVSFSVAANTSQNQTASPLVVSPGDWDVQAQANFFANTASVLQCSPQPAGLTPNLNASLFSGSSADIWLTTNVARLSISTPTLLPFTLGVGAGSTALSGTVHLTVTARRVR